MTSAKVQAYIDEIVANWPPLTEDQLSRLAVLLRNDTGRGTRSDAARRPNRDTKSPLEQAS